MKDSFDLFIQSRIEAVGKKLEIDPKYSKLSKASGEYYSKLWCEIPQELKELLFLLDETINEQREHLQKQLIFRVSRTGIS